MKLRGSEISMIFQEPMTALNPLIKVGKQVCECLLTHQKGISKKEAKSLVLEQLKALVFQMWKICMTAILTSYQVDSASEL